MTHFQYDAAILEKFPALVGGVILGRGLQSGPSPDALQEVYRAEQQATIARIGEKPLSELESLAVWRSAFRAFGVDPTQYRSAAEALLRRLTKKGDIPSINLLVDIGNLVSIRYGLPIAVVDRRAIKGAITVHFADGTETFTNLGQSEVDHPDVGEVVFTDEDRTVVARRWCWRQSDQSGAREDSTDVIITIEAHHANGRADVEAAVNDVLALLNEYAGGEYEYGILGRENAGI
jgi:DNA/RNA-binding domain of Phe-tRNA-synthetase-like protein